jgi:hypothetical protein
MFKTNIFLELYLNDNDKSFFIVQDSFCMKPEIRYNFENLENCSLSRVDYDDIRFIADISKLDDKFHILWIKNGR